MVWTVDSRSENMWGGSKRFVGSGQAGLVPDPLSFFPAVSSQKRLQACPQQPAPPVPSCATHLSLWPPTCHFCLELHPWQQWGLYPSSTSKCPGPQGQSSSQPQLGYSCPLCPGCGPTQCQRAQHCPAPASQCPAKRGKWWWQRREQQQ